MGVEDKPLVTFALLAYNQERYIYDAVKGALAQDYTPLEIIISDDSSVDQTFNIIRDLISDYEGPHKVVLNLNKSNLGIIGHVNKIFSMASGELIVVAAGDDISHSFRASTLADIFYNSDRQPLLIHSLVEKISPEGEFLGLKHPPLKSNRCADQISIAPTLDAVYIGASGAWNKQLFEIFGPIGHLEAYEDIVLGARAAMMGGIIYWPAPLLKYRVGTGITTSTERFQSIRSFFIWRKKWISAMEDAYRQRLEDSGRIGLKTEKALINKKLESFSSKKRIYNGRKEMAAEFRSSPTRCSRSIFSEIGSITAILLYQTWLLMRSARSFQIQTKE